MSKWIAAVAVIAAVFTLSFAQDKRQPFKFPNNGGGSGDLPWAVSDGMDGTVWKVSGTGTVSVSALVSGVCAARDQIFTYSASASRSVQRTVPYAAPDKGLALKGNSIASFASNLLETENLTIVGLDGHSGRIVTLPEAFGEARYIEAVQLEKLHPSDWATVLIELQHSNAAAVVNNINQLNRQAPSLLVSPMANNVMLTGRVASLMQIAAFVKSTDKPGTGSHSDVIRSYDLPEGTNSLDAKAIVSGLFRPDSARVTNTNNDVKVYQTSRERVNVSAIESKNRLVVRATAADHELVKQAIEAMK
ncbi:hypothetical protein OAU50_00920 [Planctomycetota bacterium]|nr:hypothetical protein [Planctomycetota bacterium]